MSRPRLPTAIELAHQLIRERLSPGDTAVDATVGNGHDTVFLASIVGAGGRVIGFDIQETAIQITAAKASGFPHVTLHVESHESIGKYVTGGVQAVMFNLGYLPGGDKSITTRPESTIKALNLSTNLLSGGGLITIAVYGGHPGGDQEATALEEWSRQLTQERFGVAKYQFLNQRNSPPYLLVIGRR